MKVPKCIVYVMCVILATLGTLLIRHYFQLEGVVVLACCSVAAFWGWVISWLYTANRLTVSHIVGIWMVVTGTLMGAASYYLARRGVHENLETLSRDAIIYAVSGAGGYFLKSGFENVRKHKTDATTEQSRDI